MAKDKKAKKATPVTGEKIKMTAEEKAAKKAKRLEEAKNRPPVQRPNGKQIDVIADEFDKNGEPVGAHVRNFGYAVRKMGTLVTSVAYDADGNITSTSVTFIPGSKVKSKKNHGMIVAGVAGVGKGEKDDDSEDEGEEAEQEEAAPAKKDKKGKKSKKND